ncbi:hypothetical protein [Clostridium tarantellae]|uniref:Uncharacterized protein n=1 Tax=Clostridium tarantellae TaxID=39493 RepID=A0A6I1MMM8_9CLOT|nr:hypothetical protein [Clostridium tarantellae]MPQ44746.1 hypothetical protein [Clostridium tarantellae]
MKNDKLLIANKFNMDDIINPFLSLYANWVIGNKESQIQISEFDHILINFMFDYKNNIAMHYFHSENINLNNLLDLYELLKNKKEWYMEYNDLKLLSKMAFYLHKMKKSYKVCKYKEGITLFIIRLLIKAEFITSEVHFNLMKIWNNDREFLKLIESKNIKQVQENKLVKYNNSIELHKLLSCDFSVEILVEKIYKILQVLNDNLESDEDNILEIYSEYKYLYSSFDDFLNYRKTLKENELIKNLLIDIAHFREVIELIIKYENKENI